VDTLKGGHGMPTFIQPLLKEFTKEIVNIYGNHLKAVILYGSYARGDYNENSDIDIMILVELSELEIKEYRHELSELTYEFNMQYDLDIKPIAKSMEIFMKWLDVYPFYKNVNEEGVALYRAA